MNAAYCTFLPLFRSWTICSKLGFLKLLVLEGEFDKFMDYGNTRIKVAEKIGHFNWKVGAKDRYYDFIGTF